MEIDRETDNWCTALLKEIALLDRPLSTKLTRRLKNVEVLGGGKQGRKLGKVSIIYVDHNALYERAAERLRKSPEWRNMTDDATVSAVYRSIYKLVSQYRYPGSVETKQEPRW